MKKLNFVLTSLLLVAVLLTPAFAFQRGSSNSGKVRQEGQRRSALQPTTMSSLYVVHGIPGQDIGVDPALPVDILVNDAICVLDGFEFGNVAGPVSLDPAAYNFKISLANVETPCSNDAILMADATLESGKNYTAIAHLNADGDPVVGLFENNLSPTGRGKARIIVHHTAAAPAVDIEVMRGDYEDMGKFPRIKVQNFENGDQVAAEIRPGEWNVVIYPAGSSTPVFGPVTVELQPYTAYLIYAVGSVNSGSFTLITKPVYGLK